MPKPRRSYYVDNEIIATINDLYSRGFGRNKSQIVRRIFKAGIDVLKEEGADSIPPDKPRRHEDVEDLGPAEKSGGDSVDVDRDRKPSDARPLPRGATVDSTENGHSDGSTTEADDAEAGDSGGGSSLFPWNN